MENLKVGDIVYLKSGSPAMTVRRIRRNEDGVIMMVCVDYFKKEYFNESLEFKFEQLTKEPNPLIVGFNS